MITIAMITIAMITINTINQAVITTNIFQDTEESDAVWKSLRGVSKVSLDDFLD
jgi:hypothetical protein